MKNDKHVAKRANMLQKQDAKNKGKKLRQMKPD